jgi:hypothetical protein
MNRVSLQTGCSGPFRRNMQLLGIHHLTAISADAPGNLAFYTSLLGMRLVKKTVNRLSSRDGARRSRPG